MFLRSRPAAACADLSGTCRRWRKLTEIATGPIIGAASIRRARWLDKLGPRDRRTSWGCRARAWPLLDPTTNDLKVLAFAGGIPNQQADALRPWRTCRCAARVLEGKGVAFVGNGSGAKSAAGGRTSR